MINKNLNNWLATGDRGISSEAIASQLTSINIVESCWFSTHPRDPSDFGRCMRLLDAVPEFRPRLKEMAEVSPVWAALVKQWDELESLYKEEFPTGKAPKLYDRMQKIESETINPTPPSLTR